MPRLPAPGGHPPAAAGQGLLTDPGDGPYNSGRRHPHRLVPPAGQEEPPPPDHEGLTGAIPRFGPAGRDSTGRAPLPHPNLPRLGGGLTVLRTMAGTVQQASRTTPRGARTER
jgi:hypothetical protein